MPPSDIASLTARIRAFRDARDWLQFHSPKDLTVAIAAEAGELMQPFVWKSPEESWDIARAKQAEVASEIADVGILLFELADNLGLDLAAVMLEKIERNEVRYPADKARGSNLKYNEL
jgi:dCTP diphosphatase